jgi:hypothetical protein
LSYFQQINGGKTLEIAGVKLIEFQLLARTTQLSHFDSVLRKHGTVPRECSGTTQGSNKRQFLEYRRHEIDKKPGDNRGAAYTLHNT